MRFTIWLIKIYLKAYKRYNKMIMNNRHPLERFIEFAKDFAERFVNLIDGEYVSDCKTFKIVKKDIPLTTRVGHTSGDIHVSNKFDPSQKKEMVFSLLWCYFTFEQFKKDVVTSFSDKELKIYALSYIRAYETLNISEEPIEVIDEINRFWTLRRSAREIKTLLDMYPILKNTSLQFYYEEKMKDPIEQIILENDKKLTSK